MIAKPLQYGRTVHRRARSAKEEFLTKLFGQPTQPTKGKRWASMSSWNTKGSNIIGLGYGTKHVQGSGVVGQAALRVYVKKKLPKKDVRSSFRIPPEINGVPTDVIEVGNFLAAVRPASGGAQGGSPHVVPGTLGSLVRGRSGSSDRYILSCFHVLAEISAPQLQGDIVEPSGGAKIAELWAWMNLRGTSNTVDAAIGRLPNPHDFLPVLNGIGRINPTPMAAFQHQTVKKSGSVSPNVTLGIVTDVSADFQVGYPQGTFGFVEQILVQGFNGAFGAGGDSGSLVIDATSLQPVGLLFAVSSSFALINPIDRVLSQLGIDFV